MGFFFGMDLGLAGDSQTQVEPRGPARKLFNVDS